MADILIRDIPDEVIAAIDACAKRVGLSLCTATSRSRHSVRVTRRFDNRSAQRAFGLFCGLFVLIGLGGVANGSLSGLVYLLAGTAFGVRALRSSCVVVREEFVEARSLLRTRRYPLADLIGVDVAVGRTGPNGFGREHLVFRFRDGREHRFVELNAKSATRGEVTVVGRAAKFINDRLRAFGEPGT